MRVISCFSIVVKFAMGWSKWNCESEIIAQHWDIAHREPNQRQSRDRRTPIGVLVLLVSMGRIELQTYGYSDVAMLIPFAGML